MRSHLFAFAPTSTGADRQQDKRERGVEIDLEDPGDDADPIEPGFPPAFESVERQCQPDANATIWAAKNSHPRRRPVGEAPLEFPAREAC